MALDRDQIENYIKGDGLECPFCQCKDLSVGRIQEPSDGCVAFQSIECCGCKKQWTEEYTLTWISED
jgi:hypothetical protein